MCRFLASPSLFLFAFVTTGCESMPPAPADTDRVEVEVEVAMSPLFQASLDPADAALRRAIEREVLRQADVKLRFYPVLSASYTEGHRRPPYLLKVQLEELDVTEQVSSGSRVVRCSLTTSLNKRRADAPPLLVGVAEASNIVRTSVKQADADYRIPQAEEPLWIARRDVVSATDRALNGTLESLLPAIDRELRLRRAAAEPRAATAADR